MSDKTFFITTPIYYINATPHIGHAYTQVAADARARFERLRGRRVYFLTGTDENAEKVARVARAQGREPQEFCDELAQAFRDVWDALGISYDDYIRTTEERHKIVVQRVFSRLWQSGCLSVGTYAGWYSVPDETFFREEDTIERDGAHYITNPTEDQTKAPLEWVEEKTHFFELSKFADQLLKLYDERPEMLRPETRRNETLSYIRQGLRDTSVSREMDWGIALPTDVPNYENHVVYVWFDALINYASAPGYLSDDPARRAFFDEVWPPDLQLMSKDIFTRFHASLWPAVLSGLGLEQPRELFAHGFWNVDGEKISKRFPETIVEPIQFSSQLAEWAGADFRVGVDALRYYMLREVTFGVDGDFSRLGCAMRYNSDLANGLGNLVNRAISMLNQYFEGEVPEGRVPEGTLSEDGDLGLIRAIEAAHPRVEAAYASLDFSGALSTIWECVSLGNRLIEEQKPWVKIKEGDRTGVAVLLRELLALCGWASVVLSPALPRSMARLRELLNLPDDAAWTAEAVNATVLTPGHKVQKPQPLFPRIAETHLEKLREEIRLQKEKREKERLQKESVKKNNMESVNETPSVPANAVEASIGTPDVGAAPTAADTPAMAPAAAASGETAPVEAVLTEATPAVQYIEYDDFAKVQLRAAKVIEAERIPKADKLLRLVVDLGDEQRQILAGIAQQYAPEDLIGKTIVVVANLAPRKMRGLESQGMLLAASPTSDAPPAGLLTVDSDVPPGSIIR